MLRRRVFTLSLVVLAVLVGSMTNGHTARAEVVEAEELAPGVVHQSRRLPGPVSLELIHLAADAQVDIQPVLSSDRVDGGREVVSSICKRTDALACVNGSFPVCPTCEHPFGGVIRDQTLLRIPTAAQEQVSIIDGVLTSRPWDWTSQLGAGHPDGRRTISIGAVNIYRPDDLVTMYSPHYGARTGTPGGGIEVVLQAPDELVLGHIQDAKVLGIQPVGNSAIPRDGVVLSATGPAAQRLEAFVHEALAAKVPLDLRVDASAGISQSIAGHPILLRDGHKLALQQNDGKVVNRHPRTLLGWNPAGERWFVVVDGRQSNHSIGMTLDEATNYLIALGATEAINLDGGGSSTMVTRCPAGHCVRNRPSGGRQRAIWVGLTITARPAPVPAPTTTAAPTTTTTAPPPPTTTTAPPPTTTTTSAPRDVAVAARNGDDGRGSSGSDSPPPIAPVDDARTDAVVAELDLAPVPAEREAPAEAAPTEVTTTTSPGTGPDADEGEIVFDPPTKADLDAPVTELVLVDQPEVAAPAEPGPISENRTVQAWVAFAMILVSLAGLRTLRLVALRRHHL